MPSSRPVFLSEYYHSAPEYSTVGRETQHPAFRQYAILSDRRGAVICPAARSGSPAGRFVLCLLVSSPQAREGQDGPAQGQSAEDQPEAQVFLPLAVLTVSCG